MNTGELRATLNELAAVLSEGESGFRDCAAKIAHPHYCTNLLTIASQRAALTAEIRAELARFRAAPKLSRSAIDSGWADLDIALESGTDSAILEAAERGASSTVCCYREALAKNLPPHIRKLLERHCRLLQEWLVELRAMRDSARKASEEAAESTPSI